MATVTQEGGWQLLVPTINPLGWRAARSSTESVLGIAGHGHAQIDFWNREGRKPKYQEAHIEFQGLPMPLCLAQLPVTVRG